MKPSDLSDDDIRNFKITDEDIEMIEKYLPAMNNTIKDMGNNLVRIAGELTKEFPPEMIAGMMGIVDRQFAETTEPVVPEVLHAIKSVLEISMSLLESKD